MINVKINENSRRWLEHKELLKHDTNMHKMSMCVCECERERISISIYVCTEV